MSRTNKNSQQNLKPKFDTKPYERPGLTEADILEIKESFDLFDRDHIGLINPSALKSALASLGPEARNEPIYQLIMDLDSEGSGSITFEQFIHLLTPKLLEGDSRENIDNIFALFDSEKTGFICVTDLRRIAHEMGQEVDDKDLSDMISRADEDKDGRVSREEFFNLMSNLGA